MIEARHHEWDHGNLCDEAGSHVPVATPADAARLFASLAEGPCERLALACLDDRARLIAFDADAPGEPFRAVMPVAAMLRRAAGIGATSILIGHNHPGGDPAPSCADVRATRRLAAGAEAIGLVLLDHLIVAEGRWASFRLLGLL